MEMRLPFGKSLFLELTLFCHSFRIIEMFYCVFQGEMAQYDLVRRMVPFLDIHLVIPLLEFAEPRKVCYVILSFNNILISSIFLFRFMMMSLLLLLNVKFSQKPS